MAIKWPAMLFVGVHFSLTVAGFFFDAAWQMTILDTGGDSAPFLLVVLHYLVLILALPILLPLLYFGESLITLDPWHGIGLLLILTVALLNSTLAFVLCHRGLKSWTASRR
jgi:hypothetical protein